MKILMLTFEAPPQSGGGLSTYVREFMAARKRSGHPTVVLVPDDTVRTTTRNLSGCVELVRFNPFQNSSFQYMGYWGALSYAISDLAAEIIEGGFQPDWIEVCDGFGLGYFTIQRKLTLEQPFADLPIVVTAHTPAMLIDEWDHRSTSKMPRHFIKEMEIFCLQAADMVISPSSFLIEELKRTWDLKLENVEIVPNPLELDSIADSSLIARNVRPDEITYAATSRVTYLKGTPELIAGFDHYWSRGGKSRLQVFGADTFSELHGRSLTDHLRQRYSKWVEDGRLTFCGLVPYERLLEIRKKQRALFHPSLHEAFAYAVAEQMALGGIVAASRNGGQTEYMQDGVNGFLFDPRSPSEIAATIEKLDAMSAGARAEMTAAARQTIHEVCSYDRINARKDAILADPPPARSSFPFIRGDQLRYADVDEPVEGKLILSVVIPHYNLGHLLRETVASALASTLSNLEIIIVDDGSTDPESIRAVDELELSDSRIRVVRKANSGVADTRNTGASLAHGKYIALLDADDIVERQYYEKAIDILERYDNVGFVGSWNEDFDENGRIRLWPTFNPEPPMQMIFNTTNCAGIVVRKDQFLKHGQHDPKLNMFLDDWESTINLLCHGVRGVMIPHPLFRYRVRDGSLFQKKHLLWSKNYEYIMQKHEKFYRQYSVEVLKFLSQNGPNVEYHNPTYESNYAVMKQNNAESNLISSSNIPNGRLLRIVVWYYRFATGTGIGRSLRRYAHYIVEPIAVVSYRAAHFLVRNYKNRQRYAR